MRRIFLGKIIMLVLATLINPPLMGYVLFVGVGHVLDVAYPVLKAHYIKAFTYQKSSEKLIFFIAYAIFYLSLDVDKAIKKVLEETVVRDSEKDAISALIKYYIEDYLPYFYKRKKRPSTKNLDYNQKLEDAIKLLKMSKSDSIQFLRLIDSVLYDQIGDDYDQSHLDVMEYLASLLSVVYVKEQKANKEEKFYYNSSDFSSSKKENSYSNSQTYEQTNNSYNDDYSDNYKSQYSYNDEQYDEPSQDSGLSLSDDVLKAFLCFDIDPDPFYDFLEIKKVYKKKVKERHPDILKSKGLSDSELKKAEKELVELNNSVEILKKYLANV